MKQRTVAIVAVLVFVLVLFILLASSRGKPAHDLTVTYAGLLVTEKGEIHATFWITNGSTRSISGVRDFLRKTDAGWVSSVLTQTWIHETIPQEERFALTDEPGLIKRIGIPITATNSPMRIVIGCTERSRGLGGVTDALDQIYQHRVKRRSVIVANGRIYSVTNEVDLNSERRP